MTIKMTYKINDEYTIKCDKASVEALKKLYEIAIKFEIDNTEKLLPLLTSWEKLQDILEAHNERINDNTTEQSYSGSIE